MTAEIFKRLFSGKTKYEIRQRYGYEFFYKHRYHMGCEGKENSRAFLRWIAQVYESLRNRKGRLLDLGCGFGLHSLAFSGLGYEVFSVEVAMRGVKVLTKLISDCETEIACQPICGDALHLPFKDGNFDVVFANEFISHVPNLSKSFALDFPRHL